MIETETKAPNRKRPQAHHRRKTCHQHTEVQSTVAMGNSKCRKNNRKEIRTGSDDNTWKISTGKISISNKSKLQKRGKKTKMKNYLKK